jgi:hypothetical protein
MAARPEDRAPFSEEVLAGRGDIDDKRTRMAELEAQVRCGALRRRRMAAMAMAMAFNFSYGCMGIAQCLCCVARATGIALKMPPAHCSAASRAFHALSCRTLVENGQAVVHDAALGSTAMRRRAPKWMFTAFR